ncbi:MAG: hypothetical protein VW268_09555 [Rhodospirillaceae bacterium]
MKSIKDFIDRILDGLAEILAPKPETVLIPVRSQGARRPRR